MVREILVFPKFEKSREMIFFGCFPVLWTNTPSNFLYFHCHAWLNNSSLIVNTGSNYHIIIIIITGRVLSVDHECFLLTSTNYFDSYNLSIAWWVHVCKGKGINVFMTSAAALNLNQSIILKIEKDVCFLMHSIAKGSSPWYLFFWYKKHKQFYILGTRTSMMHYAH